MALFISNINFMKFKIFYFMIKATKISQNLEKSKQILRYKKSNLDSEQKFYKKAF